MRDTGHNFGSTVLLRYCIIATAHTCNVLSLLQLSLFLLFLFSFLLLFTFASFSSFHSFEHLLDILEFLLLSLVFGLFLFGKDLGWCGCILFAALCTFGFRPDW